MTDVAKHDFGGRLRTEKEEPLDYATLVDLPNERIAFIYQRQSGHEQVKNNIWSRKAQDNLEDLARKDGYPHSLILIERQDLGISGTKGQEERPGLAHLIHHVESGLVEAVYVVHISRLWRDQTLINAFALGELFKKHGVIIVTPQMRLNLRDRMHMRLYRMEVERAADELELMAGRLLGARDLKAKAGHYGGESLPAGYVLDGRRELTDGKPNPNYQSYQVHEPHAKVVRMIFEHSAVSGATATWIARWCKKQGIVFSFFPPELETPANQKAFLNSRRVAGGWPVTVAKIRNITTNPAYIGWRIWGGEVVGKGVFPPIIDEAMFWAVQERFNNSSESRPKKEKDPLPLAGLLYCGSHDVPRRMTYTNKEPARQSQYQCIEHSLKLQCANITAYILDGPIGEAVISQVSLPELAGEVLDRLVDEYDQAKERAASYRREMKRLEVEIGNLRSNLAGSVLSVDQLEWIDQQIQERVAHIRELADLESQPIGAAVGRPALGQADIDLVKSFLENLEEKWSEQPNGLKNAFLRLLLDKIMIWPGSMQIRVSLFWRVGLEQSILVHRPYISRRQVVRQPWSEIELRILREHYRATPKEELATMLSGRTWTAITTKAKELRLRRPDYLGRSARRVYTPEEDELIRQYYAGEIGPGEVIATGRTMESIRNRARRLKVKRQQKASWDWVNNPIVSERDGPSRRPSLRS